jgi:hypothetical protein
MILIEDNVDHRKPRVTIAKGLRGYFAVLLHWNLEHGGFWEPEQSGVGSYATDVQLRYDPLLNKQI